MNTSRMGRKGLKFGWPTAEFTAQSLKEATGMSLASAHNKIKANPKAVLVRHDKAPSGKGRPIAIYKIDKTVFDPLNP